MKKWEDRIKYFLKTELERKHLAQPDEQLYMYCFMSGITEWNYRYSDLLIEEKNGIIYGSGFVTVSIKKKFNVNNSIKPSSFNFEINFQLIDPYAAKIKIKKA